ncbi:hypothetical protein [Paraburkholderia sediminicola]|uniref:hypothetical protein n=1 Tax=Paraburkholderia sediminicola TaxID=458836 RepID=UPI0038B805AB
MNGELTVELLHASGPGDAERLEREHSLFAGFCEVKTRTEQHVAAGSGGELTVIIHFLTDAILGGIAYDVLRGLGERLLKVFDLNVPEAFPTTSHLQSIQWVHKDISIYFGIDELGDITPDVYSVNRAVIENLEWLYSMVREHITAEPLASQKCKSLSVPVRAKGESKTVRLIKRYWKLLGEGDYRYTSTGGGTFYDMDTHSILDRTSR